jgi:hypothetical protein
VYFVVNDAFTMPLLHGDEDGYLNNARRIADGVPPSLHGYLAGYSLFLIPPALITSDPWAFYRLSLDVNALLAGVTAGTLVLLVRVLFPTLSTAKTAVAVGFGVATAGVAMFPLYAMSESVLVPAIAGSSLLLALALGTADTTARRWYLAGVAFVAAFSAWANPRGLAIVLAGIAIVALLAAISDSWRVGDVLIVIGVAAVTVLVGNVVNGLIVGDIVAPGSDPSNYLGTVKDVSLWPKVAANIVRRLGYLTIASVGMLWVVVLWLFTERSSSRRSAADQPIVHVSLFVVTALGVSLVLNSMTMGLAAESRYDQLIYGRYLEIYLPPIIAIAVGLVATRVALIDLRIVAVLGVAVPAVSAALLSFESTDRLFAPINAVAIYALAGLTVGNLVVALIGAGIFIALIWVWASIRQNAGFVLIGSTLAVILVLAQVVALGPARKWRANQDAIPLALLEIEETGTLDCVAVLPISDRWHQYHQTSFFVPHAELELVAEPHCTVRVGSGAQFRSEERAEVLAYEPELEIFLWRSIEPGT